MFVAYIRDVGSKNKKPLKTISPQRTQSYLLFYCACGAVNNKKAFLCVLCVLCASVVNNLLTVRFWQTTIV